MRFILIPLLFIVCPALAQDTVKLYFDLNIPILNPKAQRKIDSLLYNDILRSGKKVGIIGYADYLGTEGYNVKLSEKRAKNVAAYLLQMGFKESDIELIVGKGEVSRPQLTGKEGFAPDRRVDIIPGGFINKKNTDVIPKPKFIINGTDIAKLKPNETIRLDRIYFEPGSHKIRDISVAELYKLLKIMQDNPTLHIQIEGHICCFQNTVFDGYDYDSEDFHLSENRAKAVYDFLIYKGIAKDRLAYKGFGKTHPLADPEMTPDDEDKNRRVEIRILSR